MSDSNEIERLRAEIEGLKDEIKELHNIFNRVLKFELKATTKHLQELYNRVWHLTVFSRQGIAALQDIVFPIEEKIFPAVSGARQRLMAIVKQAEVEFNSDLPDDSKDQKKS